MVALFVDIELPVNVQYNDMIKIHRIAADFFPGISLDNTLYTPIPNKERCNPEIANICEMPFL